MTPLIHPLRGGLWGDRVATFAIFLVLGLCTGAWAAALPALKLKLALSDRDLGLALFALAAGAIASTAVTSTVAPRIGTRRATIWGAFAVLASLLLPPMAGSLDGFAAAGGVVGFAMGLLDVSMNGHAGAVEERRGVPLMSSFHGGFSLGGLAGAGFGGALASAGWGVEGQLWIPVALGLAVTLLALPWLGAGAPPRPGAASGFGLALPGRALLGLGAVAGFCFVIEGAMGDWSAVFLVTVAGSGLGAAAAGYAAFSIAMAGVRFAGDRAIAVLGARSILVGGGALAAAGLSLAVLVPVPLAVSVGFALVGLGLGNVAPVAFSAAARAGRTPAEGVAPVATVGYAGLLLGPPIIGLLSGAFGLRFALGSLVVLAGIVALLGAQVAEGRRSRT